MTKKILQKIIEQETLCTDWKRDIQYCKAYEEPFCPKTCTYSKRMLKPEDYTAGME